MARFLLIHGAWHGAWCWHKVIPALQARGHQAFAIDLPAHGVDKRSTAEVTFDDYVTRVGEALATADEPWVLVGHSMGGAVITAVAERFPERLSGLIYLTAIALASGESMAKNPVAASPPEFFAALTASPDRSSTRFDPVAARDVFYADCSPQDIALAEACLVPQSTAVMRAPVHYTPARWGSVPRAYIVCTEDRGLSPDGQRAMLARMGFARVADLASSHSPFFSQPERLADTLVSLAESAIAG
ncbi:MAG TPA: esterase [Gammaproteobacteria bacterium]|jgi:pimeloyl-ACP methyl ester carboxylesterase|nr:esterase [Gammaproteobacteria bacterium]